MASSIEASTQSRCLIRWREVGAAFLINQMMDELELRLDGGLEVRMVKRGVPRCEAGPLEKALATCAQAAATTTGILACGRCSRRSMKGFFALDWEYRITYLNAVLEHGIGKPREQVIGQSIWQASPTLAGDGRDRFYREAMELGRPSIIEYQSATPGRWAEARVYPTTSGISVYVRDIDERKRKELERDQYFAALRESEEKYARSSRRPARASRSARPRGHRVRQPALCRDAGLHGRGARRHVGHGRHLRGRGGCRADRPQRAGGRTSPEPRGQVAAQGRRRGVVSVRRGTAVRPRG